MSTTGAVEMNQDESVAGLKQRYEAVLERIAAAARRSKRRPEDIILVAVSKYASMEQVRALIDLGHRDFGENKVQDLVQRCAMIEESRRRREILSRTIGPTEEGAHPGVRWHMIGHLQRNKVRKAIECSRLIHSCDSLRLAEEIQAQAMRREKPVEVLLQVNCSKEVKKFGCPVSAAPHLAEQMNQMIEVRLRGLMTMAAEGESPDKARPAFERCRDLFEEIRHSGVAGDSFNLLSMGMSGDYEVAIECGANIVRVGSAIFGARPEGADPVSTERPPEDDDD